MFVCVCVCVCICECIKNNLRKNNVCMKNNLLPIFGRPGFNPRLNHNKDSKNAT